MSHTLMNLEPNGAGSLGPPRPPGLKQWSIAHRALRRLGDLDALVERRRDVGQRDAASGGAANT